MAVMQSIANFRDLGGLAGAGGREIATGRLFRSSNPSLSDDADRAALAAFGLDDVVDLRAEDEKTHDRPLDGRFHWVRLPIVPANVKEVMATSADESPHARMLDIYRRLPLDHADAYRDLLSRAEQGRGMLVHCSAGKDRTGVATLLLLSALGVSRTQIMTDFLRSNDAVDALMRQLLPMIREQGRDPESVRHLLGVEAIYLEAAIASIEAAHGSVGRYLSERLGVDPGRIQTHYLGR